MADKAEKKENVLEKDPVVAKVEAVGAYNDILRISTSVGNGDLVNYVSSVIENITKQIQEDLKPKEKDPEKAEEVDSKKK